ncbi:hypothetical protein FT663_04470 [Candidozyma haemuli var. vulneris]|uniref:pyridoxal kinase n=1 Tax=Candidozyma haemuli TaxID=45357 RepID=A0A2V1ASX2_9ASCO|nr:pyridoxal kinase [[Candida] haemuloni]KAF3985445.1 hypothetical protein FT662_05141 [[Candida] haemuloni var. vulneris]KAF3987375.1 hypothetical protein FT663_04470 [[Candida] haemuloni var. vulneris]PVH20041.1 pyridoxal kinase [[Candida] haemuloni]
MKNVLSVQSHVVHGYVGGRAATFPLQFLGWDVDNINTVNFSNHTGYGFVRGSAVTASDMSALFHGLVDVKCQYDAIISGYIPSAELIDILSGNVVSLKTNNSSSIYVCDPVMGDQGHLYVDDACVEAYRKLLSMGYVDIITPNQFELELLSGFKITNEKELREATEHLHKTCNIKHIVITSLGSEFSFSNKNDPDSIYCAVSSKDALNMTYYKIPVIKSYFTGVGDLFTALLLDKFYNNPENIGLAVNQVLTIMADVLKLTHKLGLEEFCKYKKIAIPEEGDILEGKMNDADSMRFFELRIIQARDYYSYTGDGVFHQVSK